MDTWARVHGGYVFFCGEPGECIYETSNGTESSQVTTTISSHTHHRTSSTTTRQGEAAAKEITAAAETAAANSSPSPSPRRSGSGPPAVQPVGSLVMDLADLKSVDKFASELARRTDRIDLLVRAWCMGEGVCVCRVD